MVKISVLLILAVVRVSIPRGENECQTGSSAFRPGFFALHDLCHKIPHRFCRSVLLLPGGVGVGAEGEACVVVAQHTADRFHVHAILEGQGREGVSQVVEADMFQPRVL